jgi:dihydroorotase (multifunctional complex type)
LAALSVTIVNARVFTGGALREGAVVARDGVITEIGRNPSPIGEIIDAKGKLLLPGLVDLHVHFRDPGATQKEDFYTGGCAAVAGGVTTILDEPNNTPVIDTPTALRMKINTIQGKALIDYGVTVALNNHNLDALTEFVGLGATAFAEFDELGDKPTGLTDAGALLDAMKAVKAVNGLLLMNCREAEVVDHEMAKIRREGRKGFGDYNASFPRVAESVAAAKRLLMAESVGVRMHLREVSTIETLRVLGALKGNVTTETRPDHLFLNEEDSAQLGPLAQQWTPIRERSDNAELLKALSAGLVDVVASDHAPHTLAEKQPGYRNIWDSPPGIPAVETMLPLLLTEVNQGKLTLARLVEASSTMPSRILGVHPRKGEIAVGSDADLVIVDLGEEWTIRGEALHGKTRWTPYEGRKVKGRVISSIIRGTLTYEHGEVVGKPGQGRALKLETH